MNPLSPFLVHLLSCLSESHWVSLSLAPVSAGCVAPVPSLPGRFAAAVVSQRRSNNSLLLAAPVPSAPLPRLYPPAGFGVPRAVWGAPTKRSCFNKQNRGGPASPSSRDAGS